MMHPNNPCANIAFLDRKRLPRWALLMFLLMIGASTLPTTGCMGVKKAADKLKDTSRRFNENVRWHNFKIASKFVVDTKREHWTRAMENAARRFTIADYRITPIEVGPEVATLNVDLVYYQKADVTVRQMRRLQTWEYQGGSWYLVGDQEVPWEEELPPENLPDFMADGVGLGSG